MFCTAALATHEGHHFDAPSWSRESRGYAHKSPRLGSPPLSYPLSHGSLWQSLPAICLGSASVQLLFPPRRDMQFFLKFSLTICVVFISNCFGWPFLSSFDALCDFASGEGVNGPVVRPTDRTHAHFIMNGNLRMKQGRGRRNGIEMISRGLLNKSSLFRCITPCAV